MVKHSSNYDQLALFIYCFNSVSEANGLDSKRKW